MGQLGAIIKGGVTSQEAEHAERIIVERNKLAPGTYLFELIADGMKMPGGIVVVQ